jgi:hypothetical protein
VVTRLWCCSHCCIDSACYCLCYPCGESRCCVDVVERYIVCSGMFLIHTQTANCHQLTSFQTACWYLIMWYNTLYFHLSTSPTSRRLAGNASKWKLFASFNLFILYSVDTTGSMRSCCRTSEAEPHCLAYSAHVLQPCKRT